MPFEKGQSGNPAGRPPKVVEDAKQSILFELFNATEERAVVKNMLTIAKRKGTLHSSSAISAATWLWDRKYGKVKDRVEHSGPEGGPIEINDARDQLADRLARRFGAPEPESDSVSRSGPDASSG